MDLPFVKFVLNLTFLLSHRSPGGLAGREPAGVPGRELVGEPAGAPAPATAAAAAALPTPRIVSGALDRPRTRYFSRCSAVRHLVRSNAR